MCTSLFRSKNFGHVSDPLLKALDILNIMGLNLTAHAFDT